MKRIILTLLSGILFLSACGQAPPTIQSSPIPVVEQVTSILSPLPTSTQTSIPFATSTASTPALAPGASVTPLPTIPTFTPTFDVSTIVTVTPAPKTECPQSGNPRQVDFAVYPSGQKYIGHPTITAILDFLNSGGQIKQLDSELHKINALYSIKDITNDGIPDLTLISGSAFQIINILYCNKGQYRLFPKDDIESESLGSESVKFEIQDLNQNGIPEIISIGSGRIGLEINIFEWGGNSFTNLTDLGAWMPNSGADGFHLIDIDGNKIPEIVISGFHGGYEVGQPLRKQTDIYQWNGKAFISTTIYESPQYRFQAVQDADREVLYGNYDIALNYYQQAAFSNNLEWWSKERKDFELKMFYDSYQPTTPTSLPNPEEDISEYPKLAAYAYYRIMIIHLVLGHYWDADTAHGALQQRFSNDPYGRPYVEMASTFWEAYQSTHKMYDGCAAAIQYAVEHPEILIPLGSDYHGMQSHIYVPEDVCPFR